MDNLLRQIETEDVVFYEEPRFEDIDKSKFISVFEEMKKDGILKGEYEDSTWLAFSGVKHTILDFRFSETSFAAHLKKRLGIPVDRFRDMIRCYVLYLAGVYILPTIWDKVSSAIEFSCRVGDRDYSISVVQEFAIREFLGFIGISDFDAEDLLKLVRQEKAVAGKQRELAPMVNYLAVANEVNSLFESQISDDEYIRLFPIYFWVNITFIFPLRATEMLVTPFDCLEENDGETYIRLRRTKLKRKNCSVKYKVNSDYPIFTYRIPRTDAVKHIERYKALTGSHDRQFLFDYNKYSINKMFSLKCFNARLAEFIRTYLIGNRRYDYARYAAGIAEFERITAGDSRPIAMSNLFYQDIGADICRELANHMNISTSARYYTNVSKTVEATSIIEMQRKINKEKEKSKIFEKRYDSSGKELPTTSGNGYCGCYSPRRPHITGDIADCIEQDHIHECLGCYYYHPDKEQLDFDLLQRKERLDEASRVVFEQMSDMDKIKARERDFDRIFLEAHTSITRYRTACDSSAAEEAERWHRKRNTRTTD